VATARSVEQDRVRAALDSAESERRRWARELHDETLQALGGLKVMLSGAARSGDADRVNDAVAGTIAGLSNEIENLRAIITELRPASLDALGLVPALQTLATRTASVHGIDVQARFELGDNGSERLPAQLETAIYRVAQEALTNVAKHAGARHVEVIVQREDDGVVLSVADDGVGFDPSRPLPGFGLAGMRERVTLAGGTLDIVPGDPGVRVQTRFPLPRNQPVTSRRSSA
jgi:signal transduction histidine kinase